MTACTMQNSAVVHMNTRMPQRHEHLFVSFSSSTPSNLLITSLLAQQKGTMAIAETSVMTADILKNTYRIQVGIIDGITYPPKMTSDDAPVPAMPATMRMVAKRTRISAILVPHDVLIRSMHRFVQQQLRLDLGSADAVGGAAASTVSTVLEEARQQLQQSFRTEMSPSSSDLDFASCSSICCFASAFAAAACVAVVSCVGEGKEGARARGKRGQGRTAWTGCLTSAVAAAAAAAAASFPASFSCAFFLLL